MLSSQPPRYRVRTLSRGALACHAPRAMLGCVVVRRITDDLGRGWRVREFRSTTGMGLFFRCDVPGIRAETRSAVAPLESLDEDRLVELLQAGQE